MKNDEIGPFVKTTIIVLACVATLVSCLTTGTPKLPKPRGDTDTLLLIPIATDKTAGGSPFGHYELCFKETAQRVDLLVKYHTFSTVRYLKSGTYTIETCQFIYEEWGHRGDKVPLNIPFTVEPNSITILPYQFMFKYYREGKTLWQTWDIRELNRQEINNLWQELNTYGNIELWSRP